METENLQGSNPAEDANPSPEGAEPAESSPAPVAADTAADDAGAELSKVQKRIDRLTWERSEKEREAEYWRNLALSRHQPEQPQAPQAKPGVPTIEEFDGDWAKFQAAWAKYNESLVDEKLSARLAEREQFSQRETVVKTFKQREADFVAKTKDYHEKVYDPSKTYFTSTVAELIAGSEQGPEVAYYLADNPELGEQIARLPPLAAAREIGKIEAKLIKPPAPQVSKAPAPPPKADEGAETVQRIAPDEPESDKLSNEEWMRKRNKQLERKRAR